MLGFMCWVEGTGKPRVIHPTLEGCEKEAKRLISVTTGKKVLVLAVMEILFPTEEIKTVLRNEEPPKIVTETKKPVVVVKKRRIIQEVQSC
jgi:hypothetical protein